MTIKICRVRTVAGALSILEALSRRNVRFRGQRDARWKLESTLARHFISPPSNRTSLEIDGMIDQFIVNLKSIGVDFPFEINDRRARLEFARHYGVPSPLIDFSHSPYVALFFAFDGVRPHTAKRTECAAIYCLNMKELAGIWARITSKTIDGNVDGAGFSTNHNDFLYNERGLFQDEYPHSTLKYIEMPASWNRRMQRQLGVFLYDTVNYKAWGYDGLEDFLAKQEELMGSSDKLAPVLTKLLIPHKVGRDIFERLEIMGVTASLLFENHEGPQLTLSTRIITAVKWGAPGTSATLAH
jgi:hypothetical protein